MEIQKIHCLYCHKEELLELSCRAKRKKLEKEIENIWKVIKDYRQAEKALENKVYKEYLKEDYKKRFFSPFSFIYPFNCIFRKSAEKKYHKRRDEIWEEYQNKILEFAEKNQLREKMLELQELVIYGVGNKF